MRFPIAVTLALFTLSTAAAQRTWVVDDDGGVGVDFRQIQPAFQAAANGDIVLVRSGRYPSPVVLTKGLRVVAEDLVQLQPIYDSGGLLVPSFRVSQLKGGLTAAVAGLDREHFLLTDCAGIVILDGHLERGFDGTAPAVQEAGPSLTQIIDCADVRVRGHRIASVERSTVEYVQGRDMLSATLRVLDSSSLHLVGGRLNGQFGADPSCHFCLGGDGRPAIEMSDSSVVVADSVLNGGSGGVSSAGPSYDGLAAAALVACGGSIRSSDAAVTGGVQGGWFNVPSYDLGCGASFMDVAPRVDPTLQMEGSMFPGSLVTLRIEGTPGDNVRLLFGRSATRKTVGASPVDQLVRADRLSALGAIPTSGRIEISFLIPAQWTTGTLLHMQASAVEASGQATMTGSVPILVR